jgi:predicted nucleic acid-binding protein
VSTTPLRRIVCDTGPLISLEKITGGYLFIGRLYDRLIVPPAVMDELVAGQFETKNAYLRHFDAEDRVIVKPLAEPGLRGEIENKAEHLDKGERDAIRLALELELPLLIEEEAGRSVARELGLHISGIAGQLLKAVREEAISGDDASAKLTALRRAGRINQQIFEAVGTAIKNEI